MGEIILKVSHISKSFPGVKALNDISFQIKRGEVHALIGENGAGKSTLIKILSGAITPDEGEIELNGEKFSYMTSIGAKHKGIAVIYQEFTLVPGISVAENVFLGEMEKGRKVFADLKERERKAKNIFEEMGVELNPSETINMLSPAYQQLVEIAKAIHGNAKIIIMDEPTAPLSVNEVEILFNIIQKLKSQGVTIIFISHRLEELFRIADRVTVLRDGNYIGTKKMSEITRSDLISMMAGREITEIYPHRKTRIGKEKLRVEHVTNEKIKDVSFSVHAGEVLGFAGLIGAGRTELMRAVIGADSIYSGNIYIDGNKKEIKSCFDSIKYGIGYVPEDRKYQGLFLRMGVQWNIVINCIKKISHLSFVNRKKEKRIYADYISQLMIKVSSPSQLVNSLSGGNQQKVVIAKVLSNSPNIIIFDEPTRGIDVTAKQEIYKLINILAEEGKAIIMVSSDMPELLGMSDRIVVISEGRKTGELDEKDFDQNRILSLASGGQEV